MPKFTPSKPVPGASTELPTEQGYKDIPLPASSESLLLTRRLGDDQGIEYRRKMMNEQQIHEALTKLWLELHDALSQQWPPIYVMKAQLEAQFL